MADDNPINRFVNYKTKIERQKEDRRVDDVVVSRHLPMTSVQEAITAMSNETKDIETLPVEAAYSYYRTMRSLRHDNLCDLLTTLSTITNHTIQDTKVSDFAAMHGFPLDSLEKENWSKTPDVLVLSRSTNVIFLGDITVTSNVEIASQRKHEKYKQIAVWLRGLGQIVQHLDLTFHFDRRNAYQVLHEAAEYGFINNSPDIVAVFLSYFSVATSLMERFRLYNDNPLEFQLLLEKGDKIELQSPVLPKVPDEILNLLPPLYKPVRSEDELADMIVKELESYDLDKYFCKDISDSIAALDGIVEDNKVRPHIEPKSSLQVVSNPSDLEEFTDLELVRDYLKDIKFSDNDALRDYAKHILPDDMQLNKMIEIRDKKMTPSEINDAKYGKHNNVYGKYQYKITSPYANFHIYELGSRLSKGKKNRNNKVEPKVIDLRFIDKYSTEVSRSMNYYGKPSLKPPIFPDGWDAKTKTEFDNTKLDMEVMNYVKSTNGAQLCQAMAMLHDRITHLSIKQSQCDNIFIPPNGSFICVIPKEHAPVTAKDVNIPMIFIARCNRNKSLNHIEYEFSFDGDQYTYYISKLCRLSIDKLSNWTNGNFKLIASGSYVITKCSPVLDSKEMFIGLLTYLILDSHQKVSEFTDLLKYISFMPFADVHRLPDLIKDKMDLLIKTKMDAWMLKRLKDFIIELSKEELLNAKKPKIKTFNTTVVGDSLGISINLPCFTNLSLRHKRPHEFIEEMNVFNSIRPKHLYGSQFMDKSITDTVLWSQEFVEECEVYGGWLTEGHDTTDFPFKSKYAFSSDAIYYANALLDKTMGITSSNVESKLNSTGYSRFMHENCSLRGCTKDIKSRKNQVDIHTTSLDACLNYYKDKKFNDYDCISSSIAIESLIRNEVQHFSMSEKDQRGGGRPIATPTLSAKAVLMMVEKPEQARGLFMKNNIISPGINKAQSQCETYKNGLSDGVRLGFKYIYQLTEDQTKFSENDNINKYLTYVRCNPGLDLSIRALQYAGLKQLKNRVHLIKRMPVKIRESDILSAYVVDNEHTLGVRPLIGWPQGMLNCISTNVHAGADVWITSMYNKKFPDHKVHTVGLVHSDDSWVTLCCNDIKDFKRFSLFRIIAKRLFCLKLNTKKLWGSKMLGEVVSNYNLNGNVHLSVSKIIPNSFGNLNYQNWVIDVHNQVSVLQQCYRSGATLGTIILLSTILKEQIMRTYQVKGLQLEMAKDLPIDLGGYPDSSPFELAVSGLASSYNDVLKKMKYNNNSNACRIIKRCLDWSIKKMISKEEISLDKKNEERRKFYSELAKSSESDTFDESDYENLSIPSKADVFRCIKHIMPRSRKLAITVKTIKSLPFETNGLELLVARPKLLSEGLGHLKARAASMLYEMAADKYTQNTRRLAISQAIQSSGKVLMVNNLPKMTFNELYKMALLSDSEMTITPKLLSDAFDESNELVACTHAIVTTSTCVRTNNDKRQVISKMPMIETKFKTIAPLRDVLLSIIDRQKGTNYVDEYSRLLVSRETLREDADLIKKRFNSYFSCNETIQACNLIMQQWMSVIRNKLWTQPSLRNENLLVFCEDLYGKTLNKDYNFNVITHLHHGNIDNENRDIVQTIYNTEVLNRLYPGMFTALLYDNLPIKDKLELVDHSTLSENDFSKYAILRSIICHNNDALMTYYEGGNYMQTYIRPQRHIHGKYVGDFVCMCSRDGIVLVIDGSPGGFRLICNSTNVVKILKLMQTFVSRNFFSERYANANDWGTRVFWNSTGYSNLYLSYYTPYSTVITTSQGTRSTPIEIDTNLTYTGSVDKLPPARFEVDSSLRQVRFVCEGRHPMRLFSVNQNFSIPMRNHVQIDECLIQGLDNVALYDTGVMESLVLTNYTYINTSNIELIMTPSNRGRISSNSLVRSYLNLLIKLFKENIELTEEQVGSDVIVTTCEIEGGWMPSDVAEPMAEAEPDELDSVNVEFGSVATERHGRLMVIGDIKRALAKSYIGNTSKLKLYQFIKLILVDPRMIKLVTDVSEDRGLLLEWLSDLQLISATSTIPLRVHCFIVANNLDLKSGWLELNLELILNVDPYIDFDPDIKRIADDYIKLVSLIVHEVEVPTKDKSLLDLV